tara:strand:+ start:580 stop:1005 length:426 start_codon:yes stop_codon:yes gene_type:complete
MDHGIGNVVLTFNALRICSTSVNSTSTVDCIATPKKILTKLNPITCSTEGVPEPLFFTRTPPVLVGSAAEPCVFIPTAKLGIIESKRRNSSEGTRKNKARIASVPTTSTFRGGWLRTSVLHVCASVSICKAGEGHGVQIGI